MIHVYADMEALSRAAGERFVDLAVRAIEARGRFVVALSGGGTPNRTYQILAEPPLALALDWSRVHVFWSDERCVSPDDPRSNEHTARETLLNRVPIPPAQIYPVRCQADPDKAAREYESRLIRFFGTEPPRFDLVLLGLGRDGHTASLFPRSSALAATGKWTASTVSESDGLPRVTFSPTLINHAACVMFLVNGIDKAGVLREVLEGPREPERLPAQFICPEGEIHWLVDRQAAGLLQREGVTS